MNNGYGSSMNFGPAYESAPVYGATDYALPQLGASDFGGPSFGGSGFGGARTLPAYYAPMSAEYAPIPPVPASEIVW